MKWRSTAIYFLVLLLVGAVYVVLDSKQKEAERLEKQSKLVFAFDAGPVNEIEIRSGEAGAIHLVREKNWRITRPVATDVDTTAFAGFFSAELVFFADADADTRELLRFQVVDDGLYAAMPGGAPARRALEVADDDVAVIMNDDDILGTRFEHAQGLFHGQS